MREPDARFASNADVALAQMNAVREDRLRVERAELCQSFDDAETIFCASIIDIRAVFRDVDVQSRAALFHQPGAGFERRIRKRKRSMRADHRAKLLPRF